MKKLLTILMAAVWMLGVPLCALGAADNTLHTVQEVRTQAEPGWHQTYQAHGRTVTVDIPIQVPDADAFPAIEAVPMPGLDSMPVTDSRGYRQGDEKFFNEAGFFRWDSMAGEVKAEAARKDGNSQQGKDIQPVLQLFNQLDYDLAYALNTASTVRDADAQMKATWEKYFPKEKVEFVPHWATVYGNTQAPLMVYFDQVMHGIPLLCYSMNSFSQYGGTVRQETRGYVGGVAILQGLSDIGMEGTFQSMQYSLLKERKIIEADLPLCGLDKVLATYEQLISEGKLRCVQSLRLGYVAWYNKGEPESFTLLPAWVLEGELFRNAKEERQRPADLSSAPTGEYGPILVNAQTGELINPWNDSPNRSFDKPDILLWK